MRRFLTSDEVSRILGLSRSRVERLFDRGGCRSRMVSGEPSWMFRDVLRMVEELVGSTAAKRLRDLDRTVSTDSGLDPTGTVVSSALRSGGVFEAVPANTRPSLLRHLARLACGSGAVYDQSRLLELLEAREAEASTAILDRVAFPHPQDVSGLWLERELLMLVRTTRPLPFGAPVGRLTSLFFLLLIEDPVRHLHVLARLAGILRRDDLPERLVLADSAGAMMDMIEAAEIAYIAK